MSPPVPPLQLDTSSTVPPFEQLRSQIARLASTGALAPGDKLPTVRQLAGELGLAANTVARAYRELEGDGVLVTEGRRGTFVRREAGPLSDEEVTRHVRELTSTARRFGLSLPETLRLVEQAWTGRQR
ncbi:MAG TPA: GntR family transcriptional regulator [Propionibacteriaceae bacterium]|nr:GntR family transcriptional regulator [Propionibacteriaceae bacterium]